MVVATPLKSVMTLEPFIGGACFVEISGRHDSGVLLIEYDEEHARLKLPERAGGSALRVPRGAQAEPVEQALPVIEPPSVTVSETGADDPLLAAIKGELAAEAAPQVTKTATARPKPADKTAPRKTVKKAAAKKAVARKAATSKSAGKRDPGNA